MKTLLARWRLVESDSRSPYRSERFFERKLQWAWLRTLARRSLLPIVALHA